LSGEGQEHTRHILSCISDISGSCAAGAAPGRHHRDTAKFLEQATKESYGEGATLADRIGRRKYTNDRSRDEGQGAFKR